ncbi:uncharacterized protein [Diabrotica undecimpunctata]|uniref:uncharacterized protein n=1 Tax=Diabrotica undecimpunctata TaxID=50387 RepID=UPI003B63D7BA
MALFLDSSESESDAEFEETVLLFNMSKRKKSFWKSNYMKKRNTHGEFALSSEFSESRYLNYFRLSRKQVDEVHNIIENSIYSDGCNAQKPIGTKEKLAVFFKVLYIASGDSYRSIAYSYRMGDRTVAKIVNEISVAIWTNIKIFNYRLSRARQCVECAFGILASRFRVFRKPFEIKVESVVNVTKAACVLHNYLRGCKEACSHVDGTETELPTSQLLSLRNNNIRSTSNAFLIRQNFTQYFNTEGQIPWQESSVLQGKF